ncbi:hypothetical protein Q7L38_15680 [Pseudomonas protegens]|uniref:hypothetical protein n=1 Tax=Pseudomonas protegens TaxID=380021 RepID=UPI002771C37D|nr:hypothetical protein [Pseudomonas protegens]MDP9534015.1 hypothetical protein [Pseudomonas protegens]
MQKIHRSTVSGSTATPLRRFRQGLFAALLAVVSLCSANSFAVPNPDGNYNLSMDARAGSPYPPSDNYSADLKTSGVGPAFTVPVSRHHIIAYNQLRDFYMSVVQRGHLKELKGFWDGFGARFLSYGQDNRVNVTAPVAADYDQAKTLLEEIGRGVVRANAGVPPRPLGWDTFHGFYTWMPWNLFLGPNGRNDDPGEQFETNAQYIINNKDTWNTIINVRDNMLSYQRDGNVKTLANINSQLLRLSARTRVYPLVSDQWIRVAPNVYKIRVPAN